MPTPTPPADPLRDRVLAAVGDLYLIEGELGRGGMAVVYRALDVRLNRRVALKVLPPELAYHGDVRERFLREAQTAAALSHPNIVPIFSVDERAGIVFFVMALVEGESVGALCRRSPRCPPGEVARILRDVADALAYAHAHGVVHRDIKPDNILLERAGGRPMVTDFGIARAMSVDSRLTVTGVAMGTPTYMSPEQALGEREVDGRGDQYSLAVVGYEMLAGAPPFRASNTPALLMKHVSEPPTPIWTLRPDLPPTLAGAVMRALAKKPEQRWADAAEFRDALAGVGAAGPAASRLAIEGAGVAGIGREEGRRRDQDADHRRPVDRDHRGRGEPAGAVRAGRDDRDRGDRERGDRGDSGYPPDRSGREYPDDRGDRAARVDLRDAYPERGQGRARAPLRGARPGLPALPALPALDPRSLRDQPPEAHRKADKPLSKQIGEFQRHLWGTGSTLVGIWAVNLMVTPHLLWALFPTIGMSLGLLGHASKVRGRGARWRQLVGREPVPDLTADEARRLGPGALAAGLVGRDVLDSAYGDAVKRAVTDRLAVEEVLAHLSPAERGMIPDVAPTAQALVERVAALASTLHGLDADVSSSSLEALDRRLERVRAEPASDDQARRVMLLERQQATLRELADRRVALRGQLESAQLALGNLKYDLYKLRSAGIAAGLADVNSATQQARAVSRDIGHAVDAAREVEQL